MYLSFVVGLIKLFAKMRKNNEPPVKNTDSLVGIANKAYNCQFFRTDLATDQQTLRE